ncbi:STE domain-containing protein, partial [Acetobacter pasteurianus]|nr:STE domain-containing protein [Acetobacter pasteurianus]
MSTTTTTTTTTTTNPTTTAAATPAATAKNIASEPNKTHLTRKEIDESLRLIEDLKFFLATAPANWQENQVIRRYYLNHDEGFVSCVYWNNLYFITGTDIVRCIVYKFQHFGRKIIDRKKFEEGIFSDLRNLKCNIDAILEPPRSEFLEFLFKNSCLRTQKKQKVFFWFNVPHDKLMADALERDLKKEKLGQKPTTVAYREPALSFQYDENSNLFNQLTKHMESQIRINENDEEDEEEDEEEEEEEEEEDNEEGAEKRENEKQRKEKQRAIKSSMENRLDANINDTNLNSAGGEEIDRKISISGRSSIALTTKTKDHGYNKDEDKYSFLNKETPQQFRAGSDYEDDFPLDYFDTSQSTDSCITLDPNMQSVYYPNVVPTGVSTGERGSFNNFIDPTLFMPNSSYYSQQPMSATANQVAFNEEYLIEQTQPLKTPVAPPLSANSLQPRSSTGKMFAFQNPTAEDLLGFSQPPGGVNSSLQQLQLQLQQ